MQLPDYWIVINMRIPQGYVETGQLLIGDDGAAALELFDSLEGGRDEASATAMLRLDLVARTRGLDTIVHTLGCTLAQMADNLKIITKETFRLLNLEAQ